MVEQPAPAGRTLSGAGESCGVYAALPPALSELADRVVRGTRLWPAEQRDVRAELESHFHEGLLDLQAEGLSLEASVETLCDAFGDPNLAAKLIRRGKKRGRSMMWKITAIVVSSLTVVTALGGGYAAYVMYGKPSPSVDYVAQLNEGITEVPDDQRAWPILAEALLALTPRPEAIPTELPHPGDANWPAAEVWLAENAAVREQLAEAALRPQLGFVYGNRANLRYLKEAVAAEGRAEEAARIEQQVLHPDPLEPPTMGILLPHLGQLRNAGRLLVLQARAQQSAGDLAGAWRTLDTAYRLGSLQMQCRTLIGQLVAGSVLQNTMTEMRALLTDPGSVWTPELIAQAQASALLTDPLPIRPNFDGELMFFKDIVQYTFTDEGDGNGRLVPPQMNKYREFIESDATGAAEPPSEAALVRMAALHADRRETMRKYRQLWERTAELRGLPLYDPRWAEADKVIAEFKADPENQNRYALIVQMLPSLSRADMLLRETAMAQAATRATVALAAYRVDHGAWPEKLSDLLPEYLTAIPVDIYSGLHLEYAAEAGGATLYSLGRDLTDNGGTVEPAGADGAPADIAYLLPPGV